MNLRLVTQERLGAVWPTVAPMLDAALQKGEGEVDISQLRLLIGQGIVDLLLFEDGNDVQLACALEYINFANYRVAHVIALGGKDVAAARDELWGVMRNWLRDVRGCQHMQAWCKDAQARLFAHKMDMAKCYNVMRVEL